MEIPKPSPKRIGLYGGSFNPVHLGHLLVAQAAEEEARLERLHFIPAAQSPFKPHLPLLNGTERVRLLRLALAGRPSWEIDGGELDRGGISYTIETVRQYHQRFPTAEIFYLIGADHLSQLPKWRDSAELARLAQFLVISRPEQPDPEVPLPFRAIKLRGFPFAVSSSEIRRRIAAGQSIQNLVPDVVAEAIVNYRLYL
jgi:nicotinate-nucleotide adenylyltransferase